jgi:hypothetical protein
MVGWTAKEIQVLLKHSNERMIFAGPSLEPLTIRKRFAAMSCRPSVWIPSGTLLRIAGLIRSIEGRPQFNGELILVQSHGSDPPQMRPFTAILVCRMNFRVSWRSVGTWKRRGGTHVH